jgi:hypothetical protein
MTTTLMTYAGDAAPDTDRTRTGGLPLAPAGFVWPRCRTCAGNMQFVAQVRLGDDDLLAIFMCAFVAQFEEGRDDATAANFGGGCAYAFACFTDRKAAFLWQC